MRENHVDPERERMIAALCGELSPEEMREFEAALEKDEELRRDWDDLRTARAFLSRSTADETEPGYAFTFPREHHPVGKEEGGWLTAALRHRLSAASAGFAAAAAVFVALLLGGLRIDRTPGGLLVRFDGTSSGESGPFSSAGAPSVTRLAEARDGVSRAELAALARMLVEINSSRIDQLERRQADDQAIMARRLYEALARRQERHYEDLGARVELAAYRTAALLESQLIRQPTPAQRSLIPMAEEERHDEK